jgi:hypothetical protein
VPKLLSQRFCLSRAEIRQHGKMETDWGIMSLGACCVNREKP